MSAPPTAWKSNTAFNKFNPSYFNGDVDASQNIIIRNGNLYVAPNSSIYSTANQIYFDDVYSYINFYQNIHIYGLLQLDWGGYTHDVGTDLYGSVLPTLTNIFYDGLTTNTNLGGLFTFTGTLNGITPTTFSYLDATSSIQGQLNSLSTTTAANTNNLTNISYNSGTSTTTFTGNLSFPTTSINSAAILNNNFLALTGNQSCSGNKTFAGNIICSASGNGNFNGLLQALGSYLRVDGELRLNANTLTISQATLQKLQYLSTLSSDVQVQINNINTSALLSTANTWSQIQTFTFAPVMSGSSITAGTIPNSALATTYIDNSTTQIIGGIKTFSSPPVLSGASITAASIPDSALVLGGAYVNLSTAQTVAGIKTFSSPPVMSGASISSATIPNGALATQYLDLTTNQSLAATKTLTILGNIIANALTITPTVLGYLNGVTSNIQTQFTGCAKTATANTFTQQQTFNNANSIRIDGSLLLNAGAMTITNTVLQYLNGVTSNIQTQFSGCAKIATTNTFALAQTFSSLIITNGGISTGAAAITTPKVQSTGDLEITTPTSNTLYLNANKTNGDIRINTASFGSNTYIDNGFLNIYQPVIGGSTTFKATTGILTGGGVNDFCEVVSLATGNYGLQLQGGVKQGVGDQFNLAFNNGGTPINLLTAVNTGTPATNNLNLTGQLNINGTNVLDYQPVGTIITNISSLGIGLPFLICNGLAISRTTYSVLFSMIGTNYGVGDGSTTFNIPNYNGMFLRGQGSQTLGGVTYSSGASLSTFQADSLQDHNHNGQSGSYLASTNGTVSGYGWNPVATQRPNSNTFTNTGGVNATYRSSTETRPANYGVYYYIRVI